MKPEPTPPPSQQAEQLRSLQTARRQIVGETSDLKRRLQVAEHPVVVRQIKARIAMNTRHQEAIEHEMQDMISASPEMKSECDILMSIPGVGRTTATLLIAELPELGQLNARQISALAGVAPMCRDSGASQGARIIRGGRQNIRNALYMCAVSCIGRRNFLGQTYKHLVHRGKSGKVALTAVMRKLVILANTLIAEDRKYEPLCPG